MNESSAFHATTESRHKKAGRSIEPPAFFLAYAG
jgi:hypothetical protein